jgi:hypothetical protein
LVADRVLRAITGYGVRPWRTLAWLLAPPVLASLLFVAVPGMTMPPPQPVPLQQYACDTRPPLGDAAALNLAIYGSFDPALVTDWRVSGCSIVGTPVTAWQVAYVERIIGWLLIPLAFLTFTGILRRLLGDRT